MMMEELLKELEAGNAHRVRQICRTNPELLQQQKNDKKSVRMMVWSCLLLGKQIDEEEKGDEDSFDASVHCREYQVLLNDVPRTRAVLFGKDEDAKSAMQHILHKFCVKQNIEYKQGLNEVAAPFIWLLPPEGKQISKLGYTLFEAFVIRFIERYYCTDSSFFLMKSFRLFHLLLLYHDPQLALYLKEQDFMPELYAPQFFLCLYSREVPLEYVVLIWDLFIVFDDPAFAFFIGLCLMMEQRDQILLTDMNGIPEVIQSNNNFTSPEGIATILAEAQSFYKKTPKSFIRQLRLCCVGSHQITPTFKDISQRREESGEDGETNIRLSDLDQRMVLQTARPVIFMSAHELISVMDPLQWGAVGQSDLQAANDLVLIDLRPAEEGIETGGGLIPRAIQLEPNFLDYPEAFRAWLQHFDGTRGVPICIIDTPPVQSSSNVKLWRRLLLGEGDGIDIESIPLKRRTTNSQRHETALHDPRILSLEKQEEAIFNAVTKSDEDRAALRLAKVLQRETFANVSVCEGGFPAMVDQLKRQRGRVEPVIIQHDADRWDEYMSNTGRDTAGGADLEGDMSTVKAKAGYTHNKKDSRGSDRHERGQGPGEVRRLADLSAVDRLTLAVKRARELNHTTAIFELESRLAVMATKVRVQREQEVLDSMSIIDFR